MEEAFYSFGRIRIVSRSRIKSAVATAAYHAGIKLTNVYDGVTHDYSDKSYVGETYIRMPEGCPYSWRDESVPAKQRVGTIWNDVEQANKASNARLARSNYIALPHILTLEQRLECVERFVKENCTDLGMGCVYTLHDEPNNCHVDLMYLVCEYDNNGNIKSRNKKEYLCRNINGEEMYMDAYSFNKSEGWYKVYKYEKDSQRLDMTTLEADAAGNGWTRINKYPVCRTMRTGGWDHLELGKIWRKSWENILNDKFKELGVDYFVDCRSYEERGLNKIPGVHNSWGSKKAENEEKNKKIDKLNEEYYRVEKAAYNNLQSISSHIKEISENKQTAKSLMYHQDCFKASVAAIETVIKSEILPSMMTEDLQFKLDACKEKFEKVLSDKWKIHNFKTDPHFEMLVINRDDSEGLRKWKTKQNEYRDNFNECIDKLIANGEMTLKEAMAVKLKVIELQKEMKEKKDAEYKLMLERRENYWARKKAEREFAKMQKEAGLIELLVILALLVAGVDVVKLYTGIERVEPICNRRIIIAHTDPKIQAMIDEVAKARGGKTSEEKREERQMQKKQKELEKTMEEIKEMKRQIRLENKKTNEKYQDER